MAEGAAIKDDDDDDDDDLILWFDEAAVKEKTGAGVDVDFGTRLNNDVLENGEPLSTLILLRLLLLPLAEDGSIFSES